MEAAGKFWRITAVEDQDALLDGVRTDRDLEQFPYGMLLWASGIGLARRLAETPERLHGRRVLELGAGAGLPGIVAASLGAEVLQTDYQGDALALARVNAAWAGVRGVRHALLDWRSPSVMEPFEVVIGSDVLYERALHEALAGVLASALAPGGTLLLSDPLRPQAVDFMDGLERSGWRVESDSVLVEWEGARKEIALFTCSRSSASRGQ